MDREFWYGVITAAVVIYVYHHFVSPLPGAKKG